MRNFRFLKVIALLTMVAMMLTATVSAAVIDRAVYNVNTDTITISGNMQGVDRTLLSENLLLNSDCNEVGAWGIRGGNATNSPNAALDTVEETVDSKTNTYLKLTNRELYYTGIKQSVYNILNTYGFGTYRISGRLKAEDKTVDGTNIEYGDVKIIVLTQGDQYILTTKSVSDEWVYFEGDVEINSYGYSGTSAAPVPNETWSTNAAHCILYVETYNATNASGVALSPTVRDTRDLCIDDIKMQYVGEKEIYEGAETARLRIATATGETVYVNDFDTAEDGSYKVSLQLPDSVDESTTPLIAYVSGINTEEPAPRNIEVKDVRAKTSTEYKDGKAYVSFELFDLLDSSGYGDLIAIAANAFNSALQ